MFLNRIYFLGKSEFLKERNSAFDIIDMLSQCYPFYLFYLNTNFLPAVSLAQARSNIERKSPKLTELNRTGAWRLLRICVVCVPPSRELATASTVVCSVGEYCFHFCPRSDRRRLTKYTKQVSWSFLMAAAVRIQWNYVLSSLSIWTSRQLLRLILE